ncbi:ABC transporter ATP-binding protein [Streptomyces sp. NPDC001401]|uniref:ABC transporter ATP-binding protein n=1 Tax=Streptomyces sp. NPDC001401 TaxID=3364570 RepID=UPI0036B8B60F
MAYGPTEVLKGVDLTIGKGEVACVLGPNGAGKSTTIEILEGFRQRSGGQVSVLGTDPEHAGAAWRNKVGIVQQSWRDHAAWTVRDVLGHFARYYDHPYATTDLLAMTGLTGRADQELQTLSGGQRRRVDVALGIIGRPEVLFLDEPTAGFDPQARREFHDLILGMRDSTGVTVVLTTHDLAEAERLADTVSILVGGRVRISGSLDSLARQVSEQSVVRWTAADGSKQVEHTAGPEKLVYELTQSFQGPIPGIEVVRPTLEDTYLSFLREQGEM